MLSKLDNTSWYHKGANRVARENNIELIQSIAIGTAGPLITTGALESVMNDFMPVVRDNKGEFDGVYLALHGAGCAEGIDDLEGYILSEVRKEIGEEIPIVISLDLHGNITKKMYELSNVIIGLKEYPHIDLADTGARAMEVLVKILNGEKIESAFRKVPMLIPISVGSTFENPMKEFKEFIKNYELENDLLDVSLFHGFAYSDLEENGVSILVTAKQNAQEACDEIAKYVWENRSKLDAKILSPNEALDEALAYLEDNKEGYVVINEASDNPGGGCPCDGTHLLKDLLERNIPGSILGYIVDPEIALEAHKVGVGGKVSGLLGGKTELLHGDPIEINNALVRCLSDGEAVNVSSVNKNGPVHMGKTARLQIGNVEFVVSEKLSGQVYDDRQFLMTGADIDQYRIVCIKSTNHFRAFFKPRAIAIVPTDPPGLNTADFETLPFRNLKRPIYPLDLDMKFII